MPVLGSIKYPGTTHYDIPESFLLQSEVDELVEYAKSFEFDSQINDNAIEVIDSSPGLNTNSFNVDGRAPLNEITKELLRNMKDSLNVIKILADAIQSRGYDHIYIEAGENYITVMEEYQKRLDALKEEVNEYNNPDNSTYKYIDENGKEQTGLKATCTLTCDLTTAPTLTFKKGTGPDGSKESTANYTQLMAEYDDCNDFFDTYVTDAIELKDKCSACKEEGSSYAIDKQIEDLLTQGVGQELTGTVTRGTPVELTGDELTEFMDYNCIHNIPGLKVYRETVNINGVDFNLYQVIDPNNYDETLYNTYVENSLKYLSAVDAKVLSFLSSNNTEFIYNSSFECDNRYYDSNGNFTGNNGEMALAREGTTNLYMFALPQFMDKYGYEGVLHELGHTLDYAIQDKKGRKGSAGEEKDKELNVDQGSDRNYKGEVLYKGKNFYEIANNEISTVLDPSMGVTANIPQYQYGTDPNEGDYNYDFSYYGRDELIKNYGNENGVDDKASEYFADSFRKYYSLDPEERARYRFLMPDTFGYFDQLVGDL